MDPRRVLADGPHELDDRRRLGGVDAAPEARHDGWVARDDLGRGLDHGLGHVTPVDEDAAPVRERLLRAEEVLPRGADPARPVERVALETALLGGDDAAPGSQVVADHAVEPLRVLLRREDVDHAAHERVARPAILRAEDLEVALARRDSEGRVAADRKSTRLNSSHVEI